MRNSVGVRNKICANTYWYPSSQSPWICGVMKTISNLQLGVSLLRTQMANHFIEQFGNIFALVLICGAMFRKVELFDWMDFDFGILTWVKIRKRNIRKKRKNIQNAFTFCFSFPFWFMEIMGSISKSDALVQIIKLNDSLMRLL